MGLKSLTDDARSVARCYFPDAREVDAEPYGSGHINDSFRVVCVLDSGSRQLLLQRVNHSVFRRPELVMNNIKRVTQHIIAKLSEAGVVYEGRRALRMLSTANREPWFRSNNGSWWRAFDFVDGSVMVHEITPESVEAAGAAYGRFQSWLADYNGPPIEETIPRFHDTPHRLQQLEEAITDNPCRRVDEARIEIERVLELKELAGALARLENGHGLPRRVVHNDAKLDNVLFDEATGAALCVVDLDTVMPGTILYDFGDMVRSMSTPTVEDEEDFEKVGVQDSLFSALVRGYLSEANAFLTDVERNNLVRAGQVLTYELVIRFLADHLRGDAYFKVHKPQHNLIRTRSQLHLLETLLDREARLDEIVEHEVARLH
ncbi:MAG: aminoglycoside phosphotransferase family protein [bacterium]|nr:aminoglycoside phosphotransferase family protein [bacterium]